jgi:putative nucleotidyltransferase with HDIG domain
MAHILIVDDDEAVRGPLSGQLETMEHTCDLAVNGEEALARVHEREYDLIISDIRMPVMDGIEFLRAALPRIEGTATPCMILTGFSDAAHAIRALQVGAYDYLRKPWDMMDLRQAVARALVRRADLKFRRDYREELERRVQEAVSDLKRTYDGTVVGFAALLEGKDTGTAEHCHRVRDLCVRLAKEMGVPSEELRDLELGAMLHDIGKFKIPDAILTKPGPLTPDEWKVMRMHPVYGAELVLKIGFLAGAAPVVGSHHEKFDGTGYPKGLKGAEIPLGARIFMVVDAYDTITSRRSYKEAKSPETALLEIRRCSGTHFDPAVVEAFERLYSELTAEAAARSRAGRAAPVAEPAPSRT